MLYVLISSVAARLMSAGDGVNTDEYASDQEPLLNN